MSRLIIAAGLLAFSVGVAHSHDHDHPELDAWYSTLMQPDNPMVSCCGEADGYYCDTWYVRKGQTYCRITDDRDDEPLKRPHVEVGTEIAIPDYKLKWDKQNPTGHAVVFLSRMQYVYCFVQNGGV